VGRGAPLQELDASTMS